MENWIVANIQLHYLARINLGKTKATVDHRVHIGSERLVLSEGDDMILTCNTSRPVPVVWKWDVRPIGTQCLFLFLIGLNPTLKKRYWRAVQTHVSLHD